MDRNVHYEVLRNEDDSEVEEHSTTPNLGATMVAVNTEEPAAPAANENGATPPPPEYSETASATQNPSSNSDSSVVQGLPAYDIAVDLPTYEEAERTKREEAERGPTVVESDSDSSVHGLRAWLNSNWHSQVQLGTDGMFLCTFLIAFVFNWIGLLASLCITNTVAGRLGGLSGFGLSLVKWVAIFKHSAWVDGSGMADTESWLWWLLIIFGFLTFFRGFTQYIRIKRQWEQLSQPIRNNIFYHF